MADLMKKKSFLRSGEGAIASYNYEDIASGSGVIVFYAHNARYMTQAVYNATIYENYSLVTERIFSEVYEIAVPASYGQEVTTDYEFTSNVFNTKRILNGRCFFNPILKLTANSTSNNAYYFIVFTLYKISGENTINLGSVISAAESILGGTGSKYVRTSTYLDVNKEVFKVGDKIKIKMSIHTGVGNNAGITLYIDPAGRSLPADSSGKTETADSRFYIPFKIDV